MPGRVLVAQTRMISTILSTGAQTLAALVDSLAHRRLGPPPILPTLVGSALSAHRTCRICSKARVGTVTSPTAWGFSTTASTLWVTILVEFSFRSISPYLALVLI